MDRYMRRGVSATKEDIHNATVHTDRGLYPQTFCRILPNVLGSNPDHCNIMYVDGAGMRFLLAYIYWREADDLSVWRDTMQDVIVMNLDDLLCVGVTLGMLLFSVIRRNKQFIPSEVIGAIINETERIPAQMRDPGVGIYLTGGETADVGDLVHTIIADSTVTCRMRRSGIIDNIHAADGGAIVGFTSYGQATYEARYDDDMGSNGLTSAWHDVLPHVLAEKFLESYDPAVPDDLVYSRSRELSVKVPGTGLTVGELVLSPICIYTSLVAKLLKEIWPVIHGLIHCTGGIQTKMINFVTNGYIIKDNLLSIPPLSQMITEKSGTDAVELYQVFNMGHRLEAYLPAEQAEEAIAVAQRFNINA